MTTVIFFDVDNTLFDTERFRRALHEALEHRAGRDGAAALWAEYEAVRAEHGFVDLPEAVRRLAASRPTVGAEVAAVVETTSFAEFVVDGAAAVVSAAARLGRTVIVSDGDPHFQRRKIEQSGLAAMVEGRVHVYRRKEAHISDLVEAHPAEQYWLVDDKPAILADFKRVLGDRLTTVHIAYGAYASALPADPEVFVPDHSLSELAELVTLLQAREV